jgi:hypothetical protein
MPLLMFGTQGTGSVAATHSAVEHPHVAPNADFARRAADLPRGMRSHQNAD